MFLRPMNHMDANRTAPGYELKNELARLCLSTARREPERKLAWVNSVCILFLLIGILGARRASSPSNRSRPSGRKFPWSSSRRCCRHRPSPPNQ